MAKNAKLTLNLDCSYSDDELAQKRDALADSTLAVGIVEIDKANSAKAFKEQMDALYGECIRLSNQIKKRAEMRPVECIVKMNDPRVGEKTVIRLDTGEMVKIELMTDSERQEEIDFDLEGNRSIERLITDAHKPDEPTAQAD
jgi:hypothetical protein